MNISSIGPDALAAAKTTTLPPQQAAERAKLAQAVRTINDNNLFGENCEITFVIDRSTHRALMRVVDRRTQEVVLQLPPEYAIRMAEDFDRKS